MTTSFSYVDRQRIHHNLKKMILTVTIILLLFFLWFPKPTFAFDTGHHSDLVREVLQNEDFKETPIKIVQLENWLVDYYSQNPLAPAEVKKESKKLHFDNLFTIDDIGNYWMWLTLNTRNAVEQAVMKENPLNLLTILGISLHAVQDFYSHSNWVETHSSSSDTKFYSSATWFDSPLATESQPKLYTGYTSSYSKSPLKDKEPHGIYNDGINKDSYVCDNWEQAYVFAYAASRQWVNAVHKWVNEVDSNFWSKVQNYSADEKALDKDLKASYDISLLAKNPLSDDNNGHWKGSGSGDASAFLRKGLQWSGTESLFVKEFNKLDSSLRPLVKGLKSDGTKISLPSITSDAQLTVPNVPLNQRAIIVKTEQVEKVKSSFSPSFYGRITVNGQTFIEAVQRDKAKISPAWTTIKFVPLETAQVPIIYELWDQEFRLVWSDRNTHFDINPTEKTYDLDFKFDVSLNENTGDITGIYNSPEKPATSEGSAKNRAKITFYVTERSLSVPSD